MNPMRTNHLSSVRRVGPAVVLLLGLLGGALNGRAAAQSPTVLSPEREAHDLIQNLMSPYCPGLLLSDCRSEGGRQLRAEITERLAKGESREAVQADLVARFGVEILTVPTFEGIGLVAWLGPGIIGLVGLGLAVIAIRRFTAVNRARARTASDEDTELGIPDQATTDLLQDELAALD